MVARHPRRHSCVLGARGVGNHPTVLDRWELVNFQLAEDDSARTADAYGSNYGRLRQIKAEYDSICSA
ncbi:MAG: BBE domain-containing protein [Actinomycetota bacterium]